MKKSRLLGAVCACLVSFSAHAITLHTQDFINDATRANFNGFESIPNDGAFFTGGSGPYIEDGLQVEQIDGNAGNVIWVDCSCGVYEGSKSWFPSGGDHGYTKITMADGSDFNNIGFYAGSGSEPPLIFFDLLLDGASVFSDSTPSIGSSGGFTYIGFSGGGFDTVLVRDDSFGINALTLDAIETSAVPIPSSVWLFGSGLLGLVGMAKRKKA